MTSLPAPPSLQGTRRALLAALRREEAAVRQAARQEAELHELVELVKLKDADLQRTNMIAKLKDARLARLQGGGCGWERAIYAGLLTRAGAPAVAVRWHAMYRQRVAFMRASCFCQEGNARGDCDWGNTLAWTG